MLQRSIIPEVPAYVAKNMRIIEASGLHDLSLRDIGKLLLDWEETHGKECGYEKCTETVEWLSEHYEYFDQIKAYFLNKSSLPLQIESGVDLHD
jgi:hypothetical protein